MRVGVNIFSMRANKIDVQNPSLPQNSGREKLNLHRRTNNGGCLTLVHSELEKIIKRPLVTPEPTANRTRINGRYNARSNRRDRRYKLFMGEGG